MLHMEMILEELPVDLVVAVVEHQQVQHQEFNHNNQIQVGHNMDILVEQEDRINGMVEAVAALSLLEKLLHPIGAEMALMEDSFHNSLQHLVILDISVVAAAVAVMLLVAVTELEELVVVDKVVVMKLRLLWMLCTEILKPVVAVVEEGTTWMVLVMADLVS